MLFNHKKDQRTLGGMFVCLLILVFQKNIKWLLDANYRLNFFKKQILVLWVDSND
jgi:hypothetical protein